MKRYLGLLLWLLVLMSFVSSVEAAIIISKAEINQGSVVVTGKGAGAGASIF